MPSPSLCLRLARAKRVTPEVAPIGGKQPKQRRQAAGDGRLLEEEAGGGGGMMPSASMCSLSCTRPEMAYGTQNGM